jgi:helix-turn-helix domain of resolvase
MQSENVTEKFVKNFLESRTREDKILAVKELYKENYLITHIAKILSIGKNTVTKILKMD